MNVNQTLELLVALALFLVAFRHLYIAVKWGGAYPSVVMMILGSITLFASGAIVTVALDLVSVGLGTKVMVQTMGNIAGFTSGAIALLVALLDRPGQRKT